MLRMLVVPPSGFIRLKSTVSSLPFELHSAPGDAGVPERHGSLGRGDLVPIALKPISRSVQAPFGRVPLVTFMRTGRHALLDELLALGVPNRRDRRRFRAISHVFKSRHGVPLGTWGCAVAEEVGGVLLTAILRQMFHIGASG
jgi:hypothetical protein